MIKKSLTSSITPKLYVYGTENTQIVIEKYRLIGVLDSILNPKRPNISNASIPLGVALSTLPTLITSGFNDWIGIPKFTWQAFFMIALIVSVIWCFCIIFKWTCYIIKHPVKTAEEIVDGLIDKSIEIPNTSTSTKTRTVEA